MAEIFTDKRSKKIVLVSHCILNQNAKLDECAHYPGVILEVTQLLIERGYGILQMPCPELILLGLDRQTDKSTNPTVMSEDTRIAKLMQKKEIQERCKKMLEDIVYQILDYQKNDFDVVGLIGVNGSPTCGVDTTWADDMEFEGYGIFIKLLDEELRQRGISMKMVGIKAIDAASALKSIDSIF